MQYMGSKNRLSKELLPIILKDRKENQIYVEPFCGGCNMIDKVEGRRLANDFNEYLVELWRALQKGWIPPTTVTKEEYDDIRLNKENKNKKRGAISLPLFLKHLFQENYSYRISSK